MTRHIIVFSVFLSLLMPLVAGADSKPTFNRVTLNESAQRAVENDRLVVVLFAQAEGRDAAAPADEVNRLMDWALALANSHADIEVQTEGYHSSAIYKDGRIRGWRVRQALRIEGQDSRLIGDLAGKLQESLKVQSIGYEVSEARRREHLAELTEIALKRFQARAAQVTESLGRRSFRLVRLNLNDNHRQPAPMMRAAMAESSADFSPAPARIQAGTQQLSLAINGEIEVSED